MFNITHKWFTFLIKRFFFFPCQTTCDPRCTSFSRQSWPMLPPERRVSGMPQYAFKGLSHKTMNGNIWNATGMDSFFKFAKVNFFRHWEFLYLVIYDNLKASLSASEILWEAPFDLHVYHKWNIFLSLAATLPKFWVAITKDNSSRKVGRKNLQNWWFYCLYPPN